LNASLGRKCFIHYRKYHSLSANWFYLTIQTKLSKHHHETETVIAKTEGMWRHLTIHTLSTMLSPRVHHLSKYVIANCDKLSF